MDENPSKRGRGLLCSVLVSLPGTYVGTKRLHDNDDDVGLRDNFRFESSINQLHIAILSIAKEWNSISRLEHAVVGLQQGGRKILLAGCRPLVAMISHIILDSKATSGAVFWVGERCWSLST